MKQCVPIWNNASYRRCWPWRSWDRSRCWCHFPLGCRCPHGPAREEFLFSVQPECSKRVIAQQMDSHMVTLAPPVHVWRLQICTRSWGLRHGSPGGARFWVGGGGGSPPLLFPLHPTITVTFAAVRSEYLLYLIDSRCWGRAAPGTGTDVRWKEDRMICRGPNRAKDISLWKQKKNTTNYFETPRLLPLFTWK